LSRKRKISKAFFGLLNPFGLPHPLNPPCRPIHENGRGVLSRVLDDRAHEDHDLPCARDRVFMDVLMNMGMLVFMAVLFAAMIVQVVVKMLMLVLVLILVLMGLLGCLFLLFC
jgi:hypothetical protein